MDIELKPAHQWTLAELAALFNESFTGYIGGSIQFDARTFSRFIARDTVDLDASQIAVSDGKPVGVALIARQGWTCRLAAMGVIPSATGQGVGKTVLAGLIDQARARGDRDFDLEVIEQNERALRLYEGAGFEKARRLVGWELETASPAAAPGLEVVDTLCVAKQIVAHGSPDLPAAVSGWQIAHLTPPDTAYRLDDAYAVISNPGSSTVALRALIVPPAARRQGQAARLLGAIFAAHPGKRWIIPAVCPEEIGGELFARLGFTRQVISQWQMRLKLSPEDGAPE